MTCFDGAATTGGAQTFPEAAHAGYEVGLFAHVPSLADYARDRLLADADIIEQEQGYGWYFAGDEQSSVDAFRSVRHHVD